MYYFFKSQVLIKRKDMFRLFRIFLFTVGVVVHLLNINYIGEQVLSGSMKVFDAA